MRRSWFSALMILGILGSSAAASKSKRVYAVSEALLPHGSPLRTERAGPKTSHSPKNLSKGWFSFKNAPWGGWDFPTD
jgi:hypothetical protein